ncbi:hypothetical protein BD413DRAFT_590063 [Trametes elegans]|nr:hypothetical protein BD413DRAFT_590063 [Trametes elegans]
MPALKHLELFILNTPQLGQAYILGGFVHFASALTREHAALSSLPKLSVCKLYLPRGVPAIVSFAIRTLLASSSSVIHTLTVTTRDPADAQSIIPLPLLSRLPVLKHLEIEASMLLVRDFGCGSALRSLAVNEHILTTTGDAPALPSDSWPLLEELACSPELITSFLPEQDEPRRPIHTLRLCNVTYERNGGQHSMYYTPPWKGIVWAVEHTVYSAVPFKHLTFQVDGMSVTVLRELLPYLRTLETLVIVDMSSPDPDEVLALGEGFVAHLPRLHTLLLSDVSFKVCGQNCAFRFARDLALQRGWLAEFARRSPVLRRVAFTTEFEWEKGADGVWYPSELPRDAPVGQEENEEAPEHEEDADIDSGEEVGSDTIGEGGGSNGDGTTSVHVEVAYLGQL